jgi:hypothetical protein
MHDVCLTLYFEVIADTFMSHDNFSDLGLLFTQGVVAYSGETMLETYF